jgi:hypothetical protein
MTKVRGRRGVFIIGLLAATVLSYSLFTNAVQGATFGSVRISVAVTGGAAQASAFKLHLVKAGAHDTGSPSGSGNTVIFSSLTPGTYTIVVDGPAGYGRTWGGDCNAQGSFTVAENMTANCTLTNVFGASNGGGGTTEPPRDEHRTPRAPRTR